MRNVRALHLFPALLAAFLLALVLVLSIMSWTTGAVSIDIESPELTQGKEATLNLTITSDQDEEIHLEVYSGRMEYGGQLLDSFDIPVEDGKETTLSTDLIPRLGENPVFVYGEGSISPPFSGNVSLWAGADYSDVLLIMNNNSAISKEIGEYFLSYHKSHVLYVDAPSKETISRSEFDVVRAQIEDHLESNNLTDSINYLVTTKGVPLRVSGTGNAAFDSELTLILGQYASDIGGSSYRYNPFYNSVSSFSRTNYDIYLVTRLTAYSVEEVKSLIDRSVNASNLEVAMELSVGQAILDVDPGRDKPGYEIGNDWFRNAAGILDEKGYNVYLDQTNYFVRHEENVSMYASWGSNDYNDFIGHGKNTNLETDSDVDDVPDDWSYGEGSGEMTRSQDDSQSGSWSVRVIRDQDTGESTLLQQFFPETGYRYYLQGYTNISGVAGSGGVRLVIRHYNGQDTLIHENTGSVRRGTTSNWVSFGVCHLEPVEGTSYVLFGMMMEDAEGTAYFDSIRLVEIVPNNAYLDGAIAETIVSTGGRSFNYPTNYGQSLIADIIRSGVTGIKGYVYEPYLDAISHPDILFDRYTAGMNLAESYYAGSIKLSWMDVVVGDPKLAPFALLPDLEIPANGLSILEDPQNSLNRTFEIQLENIGGSSTFQSSQTSRSPPPGRSRSSDHPTCNITISISNDTRFWNYSFIGEPLYPGEIQLINLNWSAPGPDSYLITITVNFSELERDKTNNRYSTNMDVLSPSDLIPTDFSVSTEPPQDNESFKLTITLSNEGESTASNLNLSLFIDSVFHSSFTLDAVGMENAFVDFDLTLPAGTYTFLVVADPENAIKETNESNNHYQFTLRINAPPVAVLQGNITTRVGAQVIFNGSLSFDPDGDIVSYTWNVDGNDHYGKIVTRLFSTRGTFTLTLQVRDNDDALNETVILIHVENTPPVPIFHLPDSLLSFENHTFDARSSYDNDSASITYMWDFGDGNVSDRALKSKNYIRPGIYTITLTITDDTNTSTSLSRSLTIRNRLPELSFTDHHDDKIYPWQSLEEVNFLSHKPILFDFTSSGDIDGSLEHLELDLGDGTFYSGSFLNEYNHSYTRSGSYLLSMELIDDNDDQVNGDFTLTIINEPPRPSFLFDPQEPFSYQEVLLTSQSTDNGELVIFIWEVEGSVIHTEHVRHAFSTYGYHTVTLTVQDDEGMAATFSDRIYVDDIPAEISGQDLHGVAGKDIRITWTATDRDGGISHYTVNFSDGSKEETRKPYIDHTFGESGTYEVTVTVVDDMGLTNSTTFTIYIKEDVDGVLPFVPSISLIVVGAIAFILHSISRRRRKP